MAEERLIDDDKDRKYKIRINENGEEELVIDTDADEDEESDIPVYDIPVYEEDDEEAATLSPEEYEELARKKKEEEEQRESAFSGFMQRARGKYEEGDFESAKYELTRARELKPDDGELNVLMLKTVSRNFTDFLSLDDCAEASEGVRAHASKEQKAELKELSQGLSRRIETISEKAKNLSAENESKKQERREVFASVKAHAGKVLLTVAIPFVILFVLAIVFASMMFSDENGTYLILTIVFAVLTVISVMALLVALNKYWTAARNVRLNEKDSSTKLGREYLASTKELETLKEIYGSFNDDLS